MFYIKPKWERYEYLDHNGDKVESRMEAKKFRTKDEAERFRSLYADRFDFDIREE